MVELPITASADELADDMPITLQEACSIFFRDRIRPATLKAERDRGMLRIMRIGRRDFVTPAGIKGMMLKKCPENDSPHGFTSERTNESGSSETDRQLSARAALRQISKELKKPSKNTSQGNSPQSPASVIPISSRSLKS